MTEKDTDTGWRAMFNDEVLRPLNDLVVAGGWRWNCFNKQHDDYQSLVSTNHKIDQSGQSRPQIRFGFRT